MLRVFLYSSMNCCRLSKRMRKRHLSSQNAKKYLRTTYDAVRFHFQFYHFFASDVELAAYLGCSQLQAVHRLLILRRAMSVTWKAKNHICAAAV